MWALARFVCTLQTMFPIFFASTKHTVIHLTLSARIRWRSSHRWLQYRPNNPLWNSHRWFVKHLPWRHGFLPPKWCFRPILLWQRHFFLRFKQFSQFFRFDQPELNLFVDFRFIRERFNKRLIWILFCFSYGVCLLQIRSSISEPLQRPFSTSVHWKCVAAMPFFLNFFCYFESTTVQVNVTRRPAARAHDSQLLIHQRCDIRLHAAKSRPFLLNRVPIRETHRPQNHFVISFTFFCSRSLWLSKRCDVYVLSAMQIDFSSWYSMDARMCVAYAQAVRDRRSSEFIFSGVSNNGRRGTHQSSESAETKQTNDAHCNHVVKIQSADRQYRTKWKTSRIYSNFIALKRAHARAPATHDEVIGVSRSVIAKGNQLIRLAFFNRNSRHDESSAC